VNIACHVKQSSNTSFGGTLSWRWRGGMSSVRLVQTATTRILRHRFPGASETVGQVFKFVRRLHWKINAVCMSSPLVSFKSRFVTYLLNFPRNNSKIRISSNFLLSISLIIMLDTILLVPSLHCNTSLHFTKLHFTKLIDTSLPLFLGILMVEQILCTSETITHWALASNRQRTVSHTCTTRDCLLVTCPDYFLQAPSDWRM